MKSFWTAMLISVLASAACAITLEQSIELARQNNNSLLIAKEEVLKAEQDYYDVRGNLFPHLSLSGGYQLNRTYLPDSSLPAPIDFTAGLDSLAGYNDYYLAGSLSEVVNSMIPASPMDEGSLAFSAQLDQVLYSGGKLLYVIKMTQLNRSIKDLNHEMTEQDVILNTTRLFYSCLLAQKLVEVQTAALSTAQLHLNQVESFANEGLASEFDLLQARLEVAKLEPQIVQAENSYELALAAFHKEIGASNPTLVPEGAFVLPPELDITLEESLRQGLENRPELEMADIGSRIAELQYKNAKANYLPNLGFQASASLYTAADGFGIEKDDFGTNYSVGIGLSVPLFTGFSNSAKTGSARHAYRSAQLQQKEYEQLIRLEITQNYNRLRHALENYDVQTQNIQMAERNLQLAQVRYQNQVGIQLEVFDAQTTLAAIRLQYFQAINEVISAQRELQRSIGIKL